MAENEPCAICGCDPVAGRLARMFGHRPDIAWAELARLTKKHEALVASHRRLVEAVKKLNAVHCKISQVVMQSIPDDEGTDILAALAEAEELIKKEK